MFFLVESPTVFKLQVRIMSNTKCVGYTRFGDFFQDLNVTWPDRHYYATATQRGVLENDVFFDTRTCRCLK